MPEHHQQQRQAPVPVSITRRRPSRLDRAAAHRFLGLPLFLAAMWAAFTITTDVAAPFVDWIDQVVSGPLSRWFDSLLGLVGLADGWFGSLLVDGALVGVGAVLAFVPVLISLYLVLGLLEDSGYLARGAGALDGTMRALGLPGRAFVPMMLGFGCTVPALLALRELERPRDRVLAGLMVPFMSCGARLPVYVLLATAFFVDHRTIAVFSMYLLGLVVAIVLGLVLSQTVLPAPTNRPAVPAPRPIGMPRIRVVIATTRSRTLEFLRDAGTVILGASFVVWLLMAVPTGGGRFGDTPVEDSAFAEVSALVAPVFEPLGFGEWEQAGGLVTGLVAKEVVIGTLAQAHGPTDPVMDEDPSILTDLADTVTGLRDAFVESVRAIPRIVGIDLVDEPADEPTGLIGSIREGFERSSGGHGSAAALAFMAFVLLYTPCAASLAAIRRELGRRWMWTSALGQLALAWVVALVVYRAGIVAGVG